MSVFEAGDLQPKIFSFEWKIQRFYAECEKTRDCHTSPLFLLNNPIKRTKWWLEVYPYGDDKKSKDSISLYLCFGSDYFTDCEVTVDYRLSIVSKQNSLPRLMKTYTFVGPEDRNGWYEFEKQDVIKDTKNGALIDDTLIISCEITFHPFSQNVSEELKDYDSIINKIGTGMKEFEVLLKDKCCSDVTFYVEDKTMHLHRAILMCRSPVFHAMFEQDVKEKKKSFVEITDVDWEVMEELFRFIYSEKFDYLDEMAGPLLIAADKYGVRELKALCERMLYRDLTVDNTIEYLKLTNKCDTIHLKSLTIKFVADHYKEIVGKSEFEDLPNSIICDIFRALAVKA